MGWNRNKYDLEVRNLIDSGFEHKTLFFQTGGGEDENDMSIFVKNGIAVSHDDINDVWYSCKEANLSYTKGWDYDNQEYFDITSLDS